VARCESRLRVSFALWTPSFPSSVEFVPASDGGGDGGFPHKL
jgi:hypothetical protein